jgi:acyl carrier protein
MGTSEAGWLTSVDTDREDWNYLHFHPNTGLELRPHSSGLHELVAVRKPELAQWQTVFTTFPDLQEYFFKDLFSKHPTKDNLWHYEGRSDNIIVLSNGEKINPTSMELAIGLNPVAKSVLVYGQSRFQISALVELENPLPYSDDVRKSVMEQLLPSIAIANQEAPKHGQLSPDYVIFANPQKPFLRAGKGTVQKQLTLELYAAELEDLYNPVDQTSIPKMDTSSLEAVTDHIRNIIHKTLGLKDISDVQDFFVGGADSLQAINILRHVRNSLQVNHSDVGTVDVSTIYENPTIAALSLVTWKLVQPQHSNTSKSVENNKIEAMQAMLEKYTFSSDTLRTQNNAGTCGVVLLTGSTGSLGSYLLDELIRSQHGKAIWCLNRTSNSQERQSSTSATRGLEVQWAQHAVSFRQADLSKETLGLSKEDYDYIRDNVTQIIRK